MEKLSVVITMPEQIARALIDNVPVSDELEALYTRVVTQHIRELAKQHMPNVVMLPSR